MTSPLAALTTRAVPTGETAGDVHLRAEADGEVVRASSQSYSELRNILVGGDVVAISLGWISTFAIAGSALTEGMLSEDALSRLTIVVGLACAIACSLAVITSQRLYLSRVAAMRTMEIARLGRACLVIGVLAVVLSKVIHEPHLARVPLLVGLSCFVFLNVWRTTYSMWLTNARKHERFTRSVLLIGANDEAFELYRHFGRHPELGYRIRGVVGRYIDYDKHSYEVPWLGETTRIDEIIDVTDAGGAIVVGGSLGRLTLNRVVRQLLQQEVHVHMSTGINGIDHRRILNHSLAYEPMVYLERSDFERWQLLVKRMTDIAVAGGLLILTSPLFAVSALLIKLHDRGPVFFVQERVGRHGQVFRMLKLRSMCMDAEDRLAELREQNARQGPLFKMPTDPRVTGIGRVLRATSIDELPQLVNVLRGDMSLVGPRPALPSEVERFNDELMIRHNVMPGITGLWQVEGRDNPDFHLYQRLDIFYVENWSVMLDISILIGTAKVVVMRAWGALKRTRSSQQEEGISATVVLD